MSGLTVRPFDPSRDADAVAELVVRADTSHQSWAGPTPLPTVDEEREIWLRELHGQWMAVGEVDGTVVAAAAFRPSARPLSSSIRRSLRACRKSPHGTT